ncbi:hypothetical protein [Sorangium sp. So ce1099]|uniref:hypothetical protein n=1 Tax=Sorangium sp. So ce1099 TaxID=3133331 RepID=UPI003F63571A
MNTCASWMKIVTLLLSCAAAGAAGCASSAPDDAWPGGGAPPELVAEALMPRNSMSTDALTASGA